MAGGLETDVADHYDRPGLIQAIREGLAKAGVDPDNPTPRDLAPVDEFHTAGRLTTIEALAMTPIAAGMHVLDAGSGLGGTSRHLAAENACRVTGIDLTPSYVEAAEILTRMTGLSEMCDFVNGSVLDLPFDDAAFDAAVTFHVAMNVNDRDRFYGEVARVLKPGAPFCLFDVMKGSGAAPIYPLPWAGSVETSFLRTPQETRDHLTRAGFAVEAEKSLRRFASDFFRDVFEKSAASGPPPLGLHLLTGPDAPQKFRNYADGLTSGALDPVIILAKKL